MSTDKLRTALKNKKHIIYGTEKTLKFLKLGKIKTVFLASNCPESTKKAIKSYGVEILELSEPSDEIALICKRPHPIIVMSLIR